MPNETPGKVQRKRKVEASEDKAIKEKIRKAETVSRNERQKKEMTYFNTELNKLAGSSAIDELAVKCGVCKGKKVIAGDHTVSGKVQHFLINHFEKCQEKHDRLRKSASGSKTIDVLFAIAQNSHTAQQDQQPFLEPDIQNIEEEFSNIDDV
ncbi:hypothetical protein OS493_035959 [Desmophyllum pertusum]|uniref:Uncharacterized protein n=1 Tax=Desmophyllum pertusum TaxID=174260 RepID=A0A9W9YI96_9CNID|nr:hypothetical protein OS493_035959 [Desmophyllum pertusum]